MFAPAVRRAVVLMREVCLALSEAAEGTQFGKPVWRAGKKVFAQCHAYRDVRVQAMFWVGVERQRFMTMDPRYSIPAYRGPGGWIALDRASGFNAGELRSLALESYRHYASKRMLAAFEVGASPGAPTAKAKSARRRASAAPAGSGKGASAAAGTGKPPARRK